jgi:hypothetical protein
VYHIRQLSFEYYYTNLNTKEKALNMPDMNYSAKTAQGQTGTDATSMNAQVFQQEQHGRVKKCTQNRHQ